MPMLKLSSSADGPLAPSWEAAGGGSNPRTAPGRDFPGFPSGGASSVYGPHWDDVPVTLHSAGACVYLDRL